MCARQRFLTRLPGRCIYYRTGSQRRSRMDSSPATTTKKSTETMMKPPTTTALSHTEEETTQGLDNTPPPAPNKSTTPSTGDISIASSFRKKKNNANESPADESLVAMNEQIIMPEILITAAVEDTNGDVVVEEDTSDIMSSPGIHASSSPNDENTAVHLHHDVPRKTITLETLPLDSLHSIAAFLPVADFCNGLGMASRTCHTIAKEILRRVRRHGFFCATQVMAAYSVEEPEDAVQLAALYISRGIPMYCNHTKAYASMVFRMKHSSSTGTAVGNSNHHHHQSLYNRPHRETSYLDEKKALLLPGKKLKIHQHLLEIHHQQQQHGIINPLIDGNRAFQLSLSADFFRRDKENNSNRRKQDQDDAPTMTTTTTTTKNLGSFELEVYSAESLKYLHSLQSNISIYQQKLEILLTKSDAAGFEACMLDFWDEFFPETKGMHYYDLETAVPRASHLHRFLTNPCPKAWGTVQCEIERIKTGSRLFPIYEYRLYVRGTPNDMELMFAKNKGRQEGKSNNYQIIMGDNVILGRLQSNFIGTEFQIFVVTDGTVEHHRPKRMNRRAIANQTENAREDGAITYTANLLGSRPRIMDVCLPKIAVQETDATWGTYLASCGAEDPSDMLTCFRQMVNRLDSETTDDGGADDNDTVIPEFGLLALQNRPPWWNHELQSFVLNFGGRVSVASVKNFQLCERTNHDLVMLQFGRIKGRHSFTMDFQYPLTAVQAFGIAISSLQSKISFG